MDDVHGPVDFVLVEFPGEDSLGRLAGPLTQILDSGIVHLWDLLVVRKDSDGTFSGVDVADLGDGVGLAGFAGARSGLLGDDDLKAAADTMEPGTVAVLIVYENTWARPFVSAAMDAGGQVIASQRIPGPDIMAALDAIESD
ncbi:MAG: DUF1269 domain-containing protein [Acidimicrobiia bacterium]|nr:DUF1269 domain-containing protein [Acidimicrobiia bacterium]